MKLETRRREKTIYPGGQELEKEYASLQSVEITNSAKDGPRISSVKCYGQSGQEAADQAIATYLYAEAKLRDALAAKADAEAEAREELDMQRWPPIGKKDGAA